MAIAFERIEALTFDCYGTLIDWEGGLLRELRGLLDVHDAAQPSDDRLLETFARHEVRWEAGAYLPYREVLGRTLRDLCAELGVTPSTDELRDFGSSVGRWPVFSDSAGALAALAGRFRLGIITNCDDDLFEASRRRLGVEFEWAVTAQQAGSYKPQRHNFELALERIALPRERIVHVAQSLFHDHVPAKRLGLSTTWIDRRHDQPGFGATPPASAQPDLTVRDMTSFARVALALR